VNSQSNHVLSLISFYSLAQKTHRVLIRNLFTKIFNAVFSTFAIPVVFD